MHLPPTVVVGPWPSMFAVSGPGSCTALHRHPNLHLLLQRAQHLEVTLGSNHQPVQAAGLLTPPHYPHGVAAQGQDCILLFIDPTCYSGRSLRAVLANTPRLISDAERDAWLADLPPTPSPTALAQWARAMLARLGAKQPPTKPLHPKVYKTLRLLDQLPLSPAPTLVELAKQARISPSRLMHIFTADTGTPLRTYLRWLRMTRACGALLQGSTLSDAALTGGFSDAAHMSRTFKAMYGLSPSQLQSYSSFTTR